MTVEEAIKWLVLGIWEQECAKCGAMSTTVDEEQEESPCDSAVAAWNRRAENGDGKDA